MAQKPKDPAASVDGSGAASQRLDQWLWFARFTKSRTLAQALIDRGKVRLNRQRIEKSSQSVKPGDVVTLSLGPRIRIISVVALGLKRGPAPEAAKLYEDLTPATPRPAVGSAQGGSVSDEHHGVMAGQGLRDGGAGRPTKRERRQIDRLKSQTD